METRFIKFWAAIGQRAKRAFEREFAKRTFFDWMILLAGFAATAWLCTADEPPGFAVGVLAVVALVMTFSNPTPWQRLAVIILAGSLFYIETQAIKADRARSESQAKASLQKILDSTASSTNSVITDAQTKFSETETKFSDILSSSRSINLDTKENVALTKKDILTISEGNAFAYVAPQPFSDGHIPLAVWNAGKYPLTGVDIIIYRTTTFPWEKQEENIGTLAPQQNRLLQFQITPRIDSGVSPDDKNYFDSYWIFMAAQNGLVTETLEFRPSRNGLWANRSWAQRQGCRPGPKKCVDGPHFNNPSEVSTGKWSDEIDARIQR